MTEPNNQRDGKMTTMTPVPADSPLMLAWNAYKASEGYENTKRWAAHLHAVDGSLWAAFEAGFTHAAAENERLRRFETYVCQVIAMGGQADLTVESLPR